MKQQCPNCTSLNTRLQSPKTSWVEWICNTCQHRWKEIVEDLRFNVNGLARRINEKMFDDRLGQNEVARICNMSNSTICRIMQFKRPDIDNLVKILAWLDADFKDFITIHPTPTSKE